MEKLIVLGTGNASVTHCFNTCFALRHGEEYLLVDAGGGNGILAALEQQQIPLEQIHHIFVTHAHSDHILGMAWMIRMIGTKMNKGTYQGTLSIYCHKELEEAIKTIASLTVQAKICRHFDERIQFHVVEDGTVLDILGSRFTFLDIRSTKAKQTGFSCVTSNGIRVAFPGDEPCPDFLFDIFRDACELAQSLSIKNLILWHTEDKDITHRKERYLAEGTPVYAGNLYVPDDGEQFSL